VALDLLIALKLPVLKTIAIRYRPSEGGRVLIAPYAHPEGLSLAIPSVSKVVMYNIQDPRDSQAIFSLTPSVTHLVLAPHYNGGINDPNFTLTSYFGDNCLGLEVLAVPGDNLRGDVTHLKRIIEYRIGTMKRVILEEGVGRSLPENDLEALRWLQKNIDVKYLPAKDLSFEQALDQVLLDI